MTKEGVDFYVVLCIHPMHVLEEDYTCRKGTKFQTSDVVKEHTIRIGAHGNTSRNQPKCNQSIYDYM